MTSIERHLATMIPLAKYLTSIATDNLVIKTLTAENMSEDYWGWLNDTDITQYLEIRHTKYSRESLSQFVEAMFLSDNDLLMGIFLKSDENKHIGNIKLGSLNRRYARADIGIMIGDRNSWGKGYASEAIKGLSAFAFGEIGLRRLYAGMYASNKASTKAFLNSGFRQEGIMKGHYFLNGQLEDGIIVAKLSQEHSV
ncbi:MAG: acetyltransferase [Micavibrio sp.]|nr:acetyltransferase [Micavibrio sp.]